MKRVYDAMKMFFVTLFVINIVNAAEYFVSPSGDDKADGSSSTPFATIDKAITIAEFDSDTIYVEKGEYTTTTQWGLI